MNNVPVKLADKAVREFNYFVDNQVLTAGQLNTLTDYFDRQHRLTHARLFGAGIISGLEVALNTGRTALTIKKGVALTSDGDLLSFPDIPANPAAGDTSPAPADELPFRFFRPFTDARAQYALFRSGPGLIEMYELLPDESADADIAPRPLSELAPAIDGMVAVLYLESYLRAVEDCAETDCDNLGPKQINQLRVLLLKAGDVVSLNLAGEPPLPPVPQVPVRRVIMSGATITGSNNLSDRFEEAIADAGEPMQKALKFIPGKYAVYLPANGFGADWPALFKRIASINGMENGVHYAYAALKDISDALYELNGAVSELRSAHFLSPAAFPKHIALGGGSPATAHLRHGFTASPQINRGNEAQQRFQSQLRRLDFMLRGFHVPTVSPGIQITPSRTDGLLGERAIPFYYRIGNDTPLHLDWNFEKTRQGNTASILGYHVPRDTGNPASIEPLAFTGGPFYRIEGILDMEKDAALRQLTELRNRYNLPFRVEGIQIEADITGFPLPPRVKFPVWEGLLHFHRENLFDRFQLAKDYISKLKVTPIDKKVLDDEDQSTKTKVEAAQNKAETLNAKLDTASQSMYVGAKNFVANYRQFREQYEDAVKMSHEVNSNVQQFSQTPTESPLQHFFVFNAALQLDRFIDIFHKKAEKVKRQFVFDHFQNRHPGLEHLGGVSAGGTFVVVHQNDRVVADFSLPYAVEFDLDPDIDIVHPAPAVPISIIDANNFKWIDKFDFVKDIGLEKAVKPIRAEFAGLQNQVDQKLQGALTTSNFIKEWIVGGSKTGGLTGGGILNPGKAILDENLKRQVDDLTKKHELITFYENKTRNAEEEIAYRALLADYDKQASGIMRGMADKNTDIEAEGDDAIVMEVLAVHLNNLNTDSRVTLGNMTAVKNTISNDPGNKTNLLSGIKKLRF